MKLSKALKVKNKLVNDVMRLRRSLESNNSWNALNEPTYDSRELFVTLLTKTQKLAELKAKIAAANVKIIKISIC